MKTINRESIQSILLMLWSALLIACPDGEQSKNMIVLGEVYSHTFEAPYSCEGDYQRSALFFSEASEDMSDPVLLYNAVCGSSAYFDMAQNGGDFPLNGDPLVGIGNLGDQPLANVTIGDVLSTQLYVNLEFEVGQTYGGWIDGEELRTIFAVHVVSHEPDGELSIEYIVLALEEGDFDAPWEQQPELSVQEEATQDEEDDENDEEAPSYTCTCFQDDVEIAASTEEPQCVFSGETVGTALQDQLDAFNALCGTTLTTEDCPAPDMELRATCLTTYDCASLGSTYVLECTQED